MSEWRDIIKFDQQNFFHKIAEELWFLYLKAGDYKELYISTKSYVISQSKENTEIHIRQFSYCRTAYNIWSS